MVKKHTSVASLRNSQTRRFAKMRGTLHQKYQASVLQSRQDLIELTSGTASTATLRKEGHPYGRGLRRTRRPGMPINAQTGQLRRGIYLRNVAGNRYRLGSTARHAAFQFSPFGTKRMIRRGVMGGRKQGGQMGEIERRWRARLKGIRQGLKQAGRS